MRSITDATWKRWETAEAIFVAVAGTLLHFVYEWSGYNRFVAAFAPVNESVFEHLKLLFVPVLLFTILQYSVLKDIGSVVLWAKLKSVLSGLLFIVVIYYCYTGMLGRNVAWVDISLFYGAVIVNSLSTCKTLRESAEGRREQNKSAGSAALIWIFMTALMIFWTFFPPVGALPGLFAPP